MRPAPRSRPEVDLPEFCQTMLALVEQFGTSISSLQDMPTPNTHEVLTDELRELVSRVLASKIPAKRKATLR